MPKKRLETAGGRHPNKRGHRGNPDTCGAKTRAEYKGQAPGRPCQQPAGWGTPNTSGPCRLHGGATPAMDRNARKMDDQKAATRELKKLGIWGARRDDLSPIDALAEELSRTAGRVHALEARLVELGEEDTPRTRGLAADLTAERGQYLRVAEAAEKAGVTVKQLEREHELGQQLATILRGFLQDFDLTAAQQATVQALLTWHMTGREGERPPRPSEMDLPHYPDSAAHPALPAGRAAGSPASATAGTAARHHSTARDPDRRATEDLPSSSTTGPGERQELINKVRSVVERPHRTGR